MYTYLCEIHLSRLLGLNTKEERERERTQVCNGAVEKYLNLRSKRKWSFSKHYIDGEEVIIPCSSRIPFPALMEVGWYL